MVAVARDPAKAAGVVERAAGECHGGRAASIEDRLEQAGGSQRLVPVHDKDGVATTERVPAAGDSIRRAQEVRLVDEGEVGSGKGMPDAVALVADDDGDRGWPKATRGIDDVNDHRGAADRVEDLGERGLHARAPAGGQHGHARPGPLISHRAAGWMRRKGATALR
ncbi:MAG: hypothetical protein Kow0010_22210 [Dehalococcoidia bacterium]